MGNKYNEDDKLVAYGIEYSINNWNVWIQNIKKNYIGDISIVPHLSFIYRKKEYTEIPKLKELYDIEYLIGNLKLVDIRSDIPQEWKIL